MKIKITLILCAFIALHLCSSCSQAERPTVASGDFRRVVALSPSLSETLYALGLGDRIVGVTTFASYPEEVKQKTKRFFL